MVTEFVGQWVHTARRGGISCRRADGLQGRQEGSAGIPGFAWLSEKNNSSNTEKKIERKLALTQGARGLSKKRGEGHCR